ncbi:MAG: hypothetical protein PHN88_01840 [Ignavibacteria bacterium]|nr:hypothetical protein [Ignavibacteria bacterium]
MKQLLILLFLVTLCGCNKEDPVSPKVDNEPYLIFQRALIDSAVGGGYMEHFDSVFCPNSDSIIVSLKLASNYHGFENPPNIGLAIGYMDTVQNFHGFEFYAYNDPNLNNTDQVFRFVNIVKNKKLYFWASFWGLENTPYYLKAYDFKVYRR